VRGGRERFGRHGERHSGQRKAGGRQALTAVILLGWMLLAASGCTGPDRGAQGQPDGRPLESELEARMDAFVQAMEAGAPPEVSALFAADGTVHVAGMPEIRGRSSIEGFYSNLFRFLESSTAVPDAFRVSADGTMAYVTGSTTNAFRGPEGSVSYQGKFLMVWIREEGEWKVGAYSVSGDEGNQDAG
jgi:ketosteroid isomerase-like protein